MIKTFIFVEDGSVDLDELKNNVGDDVFVITYRQGGMRPEIQQPREPVSQWNDKSYSETMISAVEADKQARQYLQSRYAALLKDLDELIQEAVKDGEFQVTFECENSDLTDRVITELKKNGYIAEISDHCRNYITIYWRQSNVK